MIKPWLKAVTCICALGTAGALIASASVSGSTRASAAGVQALPFITTESCASPAPCLSVRNDGVGMAIFGQAKLNNGIEGLTRFNNSLTGSKFFNGIIGVDRSTSKNDFNDGVEGLSFNGIGVFGVTMFDSSQVPVSEFGVLAEDLSTTSNSNDALLAFSQHNTAVYAISGNDGLAVSPVIYAESAGGTAITAVVRGQGQVSSDGVDSFVSSGLAFNGQSQGGLGGSVSSMGVGMEGLTQGTGVNSVGLLGSDTSSGADVHGTGVMGIGGANGVVGIGNGTLQPAGSTQYPAMFAVCLNGGPAFISSSTLTDPSTYTSEIDCNGNLTIKGRLTTGQAPMIASRAATGANLITYGARQAQPTIEDVGEARLVNGHAYVRLDAAFSSTIDHQTSYLVFLTPEGDSRGLFVTNRTTAGFEVGENQGGRSSLAFSYRIVAKPYGDNAPRLPSVETMRRLQQAAPRTHVNIARALAPFRLPHLTAPRLRPRHSVPRIPSIEN